MMLQSVRESCVQTFSLSNHSFDRDQRGVEVISSALREAPWVFVSTNHQIDQEKANPTEKGCNGPRSTLTKESPKVRVNALPCNEVSSETTLSCAIPPGNRLYVSARWGHEAPCSRLPASFVGTIPRVPFCLHGIGIVLLRSPFHQLSHTHFFGWT